MGDLDGTLADRGTSGAAGSFFSPGVAELYGRCLQAELLGYVREAATALDLQYALESGGDSHGLRIFRLARGLGMPATFASRCGVLIDALQIIVDLTDNLADAEQDRAAGRGLEAVYARIPSAVLPALPPLMMAAWLEGLSSSFPEAEAETSATRRWVIELLARMTLGQGRAFRDPRRIDEISGAQGRLYALPLRLWHHTTPTSAARTEAIERWGFEYGRTWQLQRDVLEHAGDEEREGALAEAKARARAVWPRFMPFEDGQPFGRGALGF